MTRRSLVAVAAVAGLAALLAGAVHARGADSTKIVPWHQIGDAGLNTTRAAVVARYGAFKGSLAVIKATEGGELDITVVHNRVVNISRVPAKLWTGTPRCLVAPAAGSRSMMRLL